MNREIPVRFWESGRVKLPPATHLNSRFFPEVVGRLGVSEM